MKLEDFKYRSKPFYGEITTAKKINADKPMISKASLDSLKSIVPENIDFKNNDDLMGVAFNGAVANQFNLNDDGISIDTALAYKNLFVHKPTNLEHNQEIVVGHIVGCELSEYGTSEVIEDADSLKGTVDPVNIAMSSVVYKAINPDFAEFLMQSNDEESPYYKVVSTSWEVCFSSYVIAATNGGRNFEDIVEVFSSEEDLEEKSQYLRANDGKGVLPDGRRVFRLITGEILPVGIGYTTNPAADVKGVVVAKNGDEEDENPPAEQDAEAKINKKNKKNISQSNQTDVISNKRITMNPDEIVKQIQALLSKSEGEKTDVAVANVAKDIADSIKLKNEEFLAEQEQLKKDQEAVAQKEKDMDEKVQSLEKELAEAKSELDKVVSAQKTAEAKALFNARMDAIDEGYELSDEDRKIIASEVKGLDETEESFTSYQEKVAILFAHKSKEAIAQQKADQEAAIEAEVAKRLSTASSQETTETEETETSTASEALENAEETSTSLPNTNAESASEESVIDKVKAGFNSDTVSIKL